MNLQPVDLSKGRIIADCYSCGDPLRNAPVVYCDLLGPSFKAYFCAECAKVCAADYPGASMYPYTGLR